ncbi:FemAB family PEP-CTERM system-associated protein [Altererythrobacter aerius]|uniref:FemAB family PEP-CTERM system-associated protein n=1 Tax=Tsuneonella aeria TaxID=1837929 RepID=A0A6I4TAL5_9SPHN|nr:FemAB family XrtA/PEP-CTERM system-associated protein [Tsuneonella aeria]MXO74153.1 FemAB family PEP-CTERM system-associated protein [Tsuneonella aeria]
MNAPFYHAGQIVRLCDLADPNERARIEGFVARMGGTPFHRPAWLCAVERGTGQRARGIIAESSGELAGWLPLTEVRSPWFPAALVSTGFAVGGGPLAASSAVAQKLCKAATELARRLACGSVELRGGDAPEGWAIIADRHANFAGPIAADDARQLAVIPRKHRAEVRKGLDRDFRITIGKAPADLAAHYAIYSESVRNLGTPVFPRALFAAMIEALDADTLTLWEGGNPVASVLSLYHGDAVMPYWGGGSRAARASRANERLYFELMRHARARGCLRFDFGRSKVGSGAYAYKKNWGFEAEPLRYATWTDGALRPRNIDPTSSEYSARIELWKRLPMAVTNRLGPVIAKGLA